jgi:mRNA interferase MazF
LRTILVAPVTRSARGIPTEVDLDEVDGMPVPCAATLYNVTTVPKTFLTERVTRLSAVRMRDVCVALSLAVDC